MRNDKRKSLAGRSATTSPDEPMISTATVLWPKEFDLDATRVALIEELILARQNADFNVLIVRAKKLILKLPDLEIGYQFSVIALREAERLDEAAELLCVAATKFSASHWLLSEQLALAQKREEAGSVVNHAEAMRIQFPKDIRGWYVGITALKKLERSAEANLLFDQAVVRFPEQEWLIAEAVRSAIQTRTPEDIAQLCEKMRAAFPHNRLGWIVGTNALRGVGLHGEADALVLQAKDQLPEDEWALAAAASLAASRGAWAEANEHAEMLRTLFPDNATGWIIGLRSLRMMKRFEEATLLIRKTEASQKSNNWLLIETAALSQAKGDFKMALRQWTLVMETLPDQQDGYIGGLQATIVLGELDASKTLLNEAQRRFPKAPWLMLQRARLAHRCEDHEEAGRHWATMLAAYPDSEEARRGAYGASRMLNRMDEAESLLCDALIHSPSSRWALMEAAVSSEARFDFAEAERRWVYASQILPDDQEIALRHAVVRSLYRNRNMRDWTATLTRLNTLHERFPDYAEGWRTHIYVLRAKGNPEDAERLADSCVRRMPDEADLWLEYAAAAADQGAYQRAAALLEDGANRFPENARIYAEWANALANSNEMVEADRQYQAGVERFPNSADLASGHAALAASQLDWPTALRRWTLVRQRFPSDRRGAQGLLDVYAALDESRLANGPASANTASLEVDTKTAGLFWKFESLGGTGQGCEFGLVQRAGGADPLGLLRWSVITPDNLIAALESRFEGVGRPAQTTIDFFDADDPGNPEYSSKDTRFKIGMHTFIKKKDLPLEKMLIQTSRKMAYLRRKLIADLEAADKVFVYKIFERSLDMQELTRIHEAMRDYGKNTLLYVRYAEDGHPSGTVLQLKPGLLIGYISGFNMTRDGRLRTPDHAAWNEICGKALTFYVQDSDNR